MHLPIAIKLLILASFVSQPPPDNFERCYRKLGQDCYYVLSKRYPDLKEFEFFWVEEIIRANSSIRGAAYINKTFHRFEGTLKENRISFEISMTDGVTYRFVGTFRPGGRTEKAGRIAIDGKLTKISAAKVETRNVKLIVLSGYNQ
jgi:hypothetical protein